VRVILIIAACTALGCMQVVIAHENYSVLDASAPAYARTKMGSDDRHKSYDHSAYCLRTEGFGHAEIISFFSKVFRIFDVGGANEQLSQFNSIKGVRMSLGSPRLIRSKKCNISWRPERADRIVQGFLDGSYFGCSREAIHENLLNSRFVYMTELNQQNASVDQYNVVTGSLFTEVRLFLRLEYNLEGELISASGEVPR